MKFEFSPRLAACFSSLLFLTACPSGPEDDGGSRFDAGENVDTDAGTQDAGVRPNPDAGSLDAGVQDAGADGADAGLPDAGRTDAGTPDDAGAPVDDGGVGNDNAVVWLTSSSASPTLGETVTVTWTSEDTGACTLEVSNGQSATGRNGTLDIVVDALLYVVVRCTPQRVQSAAALTLAPGCTGDNVTTLDALSGETSCASLPRLDVSTTDERYARVQTIDSFLFHFFAGATGLDFPHLETGELSLDYQNFVGPPGPEWLAGIGFDQFYVSFPKLASPQNNLVINACGRWDLPAVPEAGILMSGPVARIGPLACELMMNFDAVVLNSLVLVGTDHAVAPELNGVIRVDGDVRIENNPAFSDVEIDALIVQLGPISGTVTRCGNLDDAPCP